MTDRIWQKRFEQLCATIASDVEEAERDTWKNVPDECIAASSELFISNDLFVTDNEQYAKTHWGPGKYFKVIKTGV